MRQVRQAHFIITNNMHSPLQVTLLTVNTVEQTVKRLSTPGLEIEGSWMFWLHGLWSRAAWWGLALLWIRVSLLENSDGGQCDNILLVFSLTGRHLLRGLPVLLCSWAWTLRVVDVLCCGASVWLRMREVILLKRCNNQITTWQSEEFIFMVYSNLEMALYNDWRAFKSN